MQYVFGLPPGLLQQPAKSNIRLGTASNENDCNKIPLDALAAFIIKQLENNYKDKLSLKNMFQRFY